MVVATCLRSWPDIFCPWHFAWTGFTGHWESSGLGGRGCWAPSETCPQPLAKALCALAVLALPLVSCCLLFFVSLVGWFCLSVWLVVAGCVSAWVRRSVWVWALVCVYVCVCVWVWVGLCWLVFAQLPLGPGHCLRRSAKPEPRQNFLSSVVDNRQQPRAGQLPVSLQ